MFAEQGRKSKTSPWVPFLTLLNREDKYATTQVCEILIIYRVPPPNKKKQKKMEQHQYVGAITGISV